jgi:hypothetical protein
MSRGEGKGEMRPPAPWGSSSSSSSSGHYRSSRRGGGAKFALSYIATPGNTTVVKQSKSSFDFTQLLVHPSGDQQIISLGRTDPQPAQGVIYVITRASPTLFADRKATLPGEELAPVGVDPTCFSPLKAEWIFKINIRDGTQVDSVPGYPCFDVFSTVNGLSRYADVSFVGIVAANDNEKDDGDGALSANVSGLHSGINTGNEFIPAGSLVMFSLAPYAIYDENGAMIPGVKEPGQPKGKFKPATYPVKDGNVQAFASRLREEAVKICNEYMETSINKIDDKDMAPDVLVFVTEKFKPVHRSHGIRGEVRGMQYYAIWACLNMMLSKATADAAFPDTPLSPIAAAVMIRIRDAIFFAIFQAIVQTYNDQYDNRDMRMMRTTDRGDADLVLRKVGNWDSKKPEDTARLVYKLQSQFIPFNLEICKKAQDDYNTRHIMGRATNNSPPGQQLDMIIGVTACGQSA